MANIKGIANNDSAVEILTNTSDNIVGNRTVKNIEVKGEVIYPNKTKVASFATCSDAELAAMLEAHYNGDIDISDYWSIGDTRKIHLNSIASPNKNGYTSTWAAQDITITITDFNHHLLKTKKGIRNNAAITLQTREVMNNLTKYGNCEGCVYINLNNDKDTTFTKWSSLPLRTWMNGTFLTTCFSTEWQNLIKETKHQRLTTNGASSNATEEVIDKIFLPSYTEVYGNKNNKNYLNGITPADEEGTQWEYYKISSSVKAKNSNGIGDTVNCGWWLGSPCSITDDNYYWSQTDENNGSYSYAWGSWASAFAPAFCI